jgi:tetratricopeptide (TPR) repeat protein
MLGRLAIAISTAVLLGSAGVASPPPFQRGVELCQKIEYSGGKLSVCFTYLQSDEFGHGIASALDEEGEALVLKGSFDDAISDFDQAIHANSKDVRAHIGRGIAYDGKKNVDRAVNSFDDAIDISPDDAAAFVDRGNADLAQEDDNRAITDFDQALKLQPQDANAYNGRGNAYRHEKQYDLAAADYQRALQFDPDDSAPYYNRTFVDAAQRDYAHAVADIDHVRTNDPVMAQDVKDHQAQMLRLLAASVDCKTAFEHAIDQYSKLVAAYPTSAMYLEDRARCYSANGNDILAVGDYTRIIGNGDGMAEIYLERAEAEVRIGQVDSAIADFGTAIAKKDQLPRTIASEPYFNRGTAYLSRGAYALAIADFDRAIEYSSDNAQVYSARAAAYAATGDGRKALADFDEAIRIDPTSGNAFLGRGNVHERAREYDQAIADYDEALKLKPDDAHALDNRCFTKAVANVQLDSALADCQQSLKLRPGDGGTLGNLGLVYLRLGRFDDAIASYDAAVAKKGTSAWQRFGRGIAEHRKGDMNGGNADISAAKSMDPNIESTFVGMGLTP